MLVIKLEQKYYIVVLVADAVHSKISRFIYLIFCVCIYYCCYCLCYCHC